MPPGPVLRLHVAALKAADLELDLGPRQLRLRDGGEARCIDLPCVVRPEACSVRFSAKRQELAVELCQDEEADRSLGRLLAGDGPRTGGLRVLADALPADFAREVQRALASLPQQAWRPATSSNAPLSKSSGRLEMQFRRLEGSALGDLEGRIVEALSAHLSPGPHERLLVNFSKYAAGDFLSSHPDVPSGSRSHERLQAFVWHLSEEWSEADGGLFLDEEAEGGPKPIVPQFNALVTFAVPRWHSVTRVQGGGERLAVYGWLVRPCVPRLESLAALEELRSGSQAAVVACVREPLQAGSEAFLRRFLGLPLERSGRRCLGDAYAFAACETPGLLGVGDDVDVAMVLLAGSASSSRRVLTEEESLSSYAAMLRFVQEGCKALVPCPELDIADVAAMDDACSCKEVKIFIFLAAADRAPFMATFGSWAAALRSRFRFFLLEPAASAPLLADFGLAAADAPTAVAWDTHGSLGRARLRDHLPGGRMELPLWRQWLGCVAQAAGLPCPPLQ